ncbi:DUF3352 domain-containing protein [Leptolyngbya sp. FACHB-36]|uniref:DUF3352 domain-containing protein n=1 Tax=Leptolyngbya sp. FACHB-36 TaxID=2692808 RepID=UPI0016819DAF|nr:DUF3352 domain-containing protein [Leptolyngbya sp. FACHB-36]MBD2021103.1 DUF3352 domain-containing protein [Leptolyngbya sp. FACHB-36]
MIDKKKKPSLLLTLGTVVLLVGGGGVAYWLLTQRGGGPGELPVGAEAIPQDALMAVSVSTDEGQWRKLREFGTQQSQAAFDQNLAQLRDRILTANGFDYDRDIKPWVGKEVTVAFLSPQTGQAPTSPQQQATVAVLPIRDALRAKQILDKPRSPAAGKLTNRVYKGFQIQETQGGPSQNYSATVLDGKLLLVTTDPKATDRAIDTYKGGAALSATPGYTQALGKVSAVQSFGKVYVNLPAAAAVTANSGRSASPQSLAQVQQLQGLAATMSLESEGVRFKSVSWLKPDSQRKYDVKNTARRMPDRLPADTLVMTSGGNLKKFWEDYSQGASTSPVAPVNPEALRNGVRSTVGLDLDKDLLPWMEGEFSLALVAAPEGGSPNLPFGLLFMVQSNDRRTADASLKQLDDAMASRYKFKVEESKIGNQSVTNWSLPVGGPTITRGWLDGDVAFLSLGAPIASTIVPKPQASLLDSEPFKKTVPTELQPNNGHFFFNVDRAINTKGLPLFQLPPGNREIFAAMKSIGVTAAISDERSTRYDVFVALQKNGNPAPLPSPTIPPTTGTSSGSPNPALGIPAPVPSP